MKNIAKFLALGVFAASTTLVAHADPLIVGSINFEGFINPPIVLINAAPNAACTATPGSSACYAGGDFVINSAGVVLTTGTVGGVDTLSNFTLGNSVTFYNTNTGPATLTNPEIATNPLLGTQTNFGPLGLPFVVPGSTATSGGVEIATTTESGDVLTFFITGSDVTEEDTDDLAGTPEVTINGTGYLTETGYATTAATYTIDANGDATVTIGGQVQTPVTPEPSSLLLLGTGLASAAGMVFRRRRSVA